jgi:hypothetical protein
MTMATRILTVGLVAIGAMAAARAAASQNITMKVQVQNSANIAPAVLSQAEAEVTRIFAQAGVDMSGQMRPCSR